MKFFLRTKCKVCVFLTAIYLINTSYWAIFQYVLKFYSIIKYIINYNFNYKIKHIFKKILARIELPNIFYFSICKMHFKMFIFYLTITQCIYLFYNVITPAQNVILIPDLFIRQSLIPRNGSNDSYSASLWDPYRIIL